MTVTASSQSTYAVVSSYIDTARSLTDKFLTSGVWLFSIPSRDSCHPEYPSGTLLELLSPGCWCVDVQIYRFQIRGFDQIMWCFMPEGHSLASIETCVSASILCSPHLLCVKRICVCASPSRATPPYHRTDRRYPRPSHPSHSYHLAPPSKRAYSSHYDIWSHAHKSRHLFNTQPDLSPAWSSTCDVSEDEFETVCIPLLTLVNYSDLSETMNRPCDGWRCYVKREVGEFKEGRIQTHPQALQLD